MAWIKKPGLDVNDSDVPVRLTDDEIFQIVSRVPQVKCAAKEVSANATTELRFRLAQLLKYIELAPSALHDFIHMLVNAYEAAVVVPGAAIGSEAAETISASSTQSVLNTFQTSGSAKNAALGFERIEELIYLRPSPKFPSSTIYFKNKFLSYDELLNLRRKIIGVTLDNLVVYTELEDVKDLSKQWWYAHAMLLQGFEENFDEETNILRLHLNKDELYKYNIHPRDIAKMLESDRGNLVRCLYSSVNDAIVDIYPAKDKVRNHLIGKGAKEKYADIEVNTQMRNFLKNTVETGFPLIKMKGIMGIMNMFPVIQKVWSMVLTTEKVADKTWRLNYNKMIMKTHGLVPEHLTRLCKHLKIESWEENQDYLTIQFDENEHGSEPAEYIKNVIVDAENSKSKAGKALFQASEYMYAETNGANLRELLSLDIVDDTRTITNNIHEIVDVLGIEMGRIYFIKELTNAIENNEGYVGSRSIVTVADTSFNSYIPLGATYHGQRKRDVGFLDTAATSRAFQTLTSAASVGRSVTLGSVATSIAVGAAVPLGTGTVYDVTLDQKRLDEYEQAMKRKKVVISDDDLSQLMSGPPDPNKTQRKAQVIRKKVLPKQLPTIKEGIEAPVSSKPLIAVERKSPLENVVGEAVELVTEKVKGKIKVGKKMAKVLRD